MSKNINRKKSRSRSPEKKAAQFEKILEAGKQLFLEKGKDGFSLRGLAKILGMNQNNLYNYVESKRELWIALRNKFFKQNRDKNIQIIKSHQGTIVQLLMKIFKNFLDYADKDFGAFSMMHLIESPPSDKIGPFEKDYREFKFLDGTIRVLKSAMAAEEIEENDAGMMSFLVYSLLLGAAIVENHMRTIEENHSNKKDPTSEILQFGQADFSRAEFRENVLKKLEEWLTQNSF
jgi:AcrR family transcriptional regulator